jgi:hypothetical protein
MSGDGVRRTSNGAITSRWTFSDFTSRMDKRRSSGGGRQEIVAWNSLSWWQIDFMVARQDEWGRQQLARRKRVQIFPDQRGYTAAPEDVILGKLQYFKEGQSEKHFRDIASMLEISGDLIDRHDVSVWAANWV